MPLQPKETGHWSQYVCHGVLPAAVQERFMQVKLDRSRTSPNLVIVEHAVLTSYKHSTQGSSEKQLGVHQGSSSSVQSLTIQKIGTHRVALPAELKDERIIGKLTCTGISGELLVVQYMTEKWKYLRFLLVNLKTHSVQCFDDGEFYVNKSFTKVGAIQTLISPDRSLVLVRLPQWLLCSRKWSKMLCADLSKTDTDADYSISNIYAVRLRDRKNYCVAWDPRKEHDVLFITADDYGQRVKILLYDMMEKTELKQNVARLNPVARRLDDSSEDDDDDEDGSVLHQCNVSYCRSGDFFVLCCLCGSSLHSSQYQIHVSIFDADTLLLKVHFTYNIPLKIVKFIHAIQTDWKPEDLGECALFAPMFSKCDSMVTIYAMPFSVLQHTLPLCTYKLPKVPHLQSLCRAEVLRNLQGNAVHELPIPTKMEHYLKFSYH